MSASLRIPPAEECEFDLVSLGECMVRLDAPDHQRLEVARSLDVYVGGAEYNVAHAIARFGMRTSWIGGLVDSPLGRIVVRDAQSAGVDLSAVITRPGDGSGRSTRMGLHFTEVGTGVRPSVSAYDRGQSATSQMAPGEVDWEDLFGRRGVRWFHTGGIFTCLSDSCRAVLEEALAAAKRHGTIVSYDLNYRAKLWDSAAAIAATTPLLASIDCLIGNDEAFGKSLGYGATSTGSRADQLDMSGCEVVAKQLAIDHPHLSLIAATARRVPSADVNDWTAMAYDAAPGTVHRGPVFNGLAVEDRIGSGDGFASGLIFSLLRGDTVADAVRVGTAHGALLHTTRGDTSQTTIAEVEGLLTGASARIDR